MSAQVSARAVLVVEDEPLLRLLIVDTFEHAGFLTFEAGSALAAIEVLQRHPEIRAVFTDIDMPGTMDGIQLAHAIRERWPPTILVVSSGHCLPAADALPEKATFLPKPYLEGALDKVVQSVIGQIEHAAG